MIALNFINSLNHIHEEFPENVVDMISAQGIWTIDGAFTEFKELYQERIPYTEIPMLDGQCYRWSDIFIDNCLIAMATDKMVQFSTDELEAWRYFVNFENYHSTSAKETDANGTAIGCTIPDHVNKSFVVAGDYAILNGLEGKVEELCQQPGYEIEGEQIWKSLDKAFMSLYNCEIINPCTNSDTLKDVSPCTI